MAEKGADSADAGRPGQRCQIRVVSGFGDRLAYCCFISQIEPLFLRRGWVSILNTNLNQPEAPSPSDSHKRWIKNSCKCCLNIGMKAGPSDLPSSTMKHECMWPKILIMRFQLDSSQRRSADHAATVESTVLILLSGDGGVTIQCRSGLRRGDLMCSFISNFFNQLCFSTASHNYGNRLKQEAGSLIREDESQKCEYFLTFSHFWQRKAIHLPSQWRDFIALKKQPTNKTKKKNLPTSSRQPHPTTYQLPGIQTVWGMQRAAGDLRRQLSFHSLLRALPSLPAASCLLMNIWR